MFAHEITIKLLQCNVQSKSLKRDEGAYHYATFFQHYVFVISCFLVKISLLLCYALIENFFTHTHSNYFAHGFMVVR